MTAAAWLYLAAFAVVLAALAVPVGRYMADVFADDEARPGLALRLLTRGLGPVERLLHRAAGVTRASDMDWKRYARALLVFNLLGALVVYALQRCQGVLPGNPLGLPGVDPRVAFNTAISFASNTNWQAYGGETTMSHATQMLALGVQNFLSAATGIAVLVALARGFVRKQASGIGNFWVDLVRTTLYVLLPLALVLGIALAAQGVPQTFTAKATATLVDPVVATAEDGTVTTTTTQGLALGPVASQLAIKQLGTNGGGFYNVNSAHPYENPNALSNFLELVAILLLPVALCFTFGRLVGARRQGLAFLLTMVVLFVPAAIVTTVAEQGGNPALTSLGVDQVASAAQAGGNMEGKEVRFGIAASTLWATSTTAASNGSVNSMHDSYTPLGGMVPLVLIQLGEVVFGGVGCGLYGLIIFAIVAVFIAGLMVGRTPELLGKKIEAYEMKLASLVILIPCVAILIGTALATRAAVTPSVLGNPGAHGFTEILYGYSSVAGNNGSAFAGLTASGTFYATSMGVIMWIARFWLIAPVLAIAGALARKQRVPVTAGTLPTDGPLFVVLLSGTVILVGALTFVPALALGPIVEHFQLMVR